MNIEQLALLKTLRLGVLNLRILGYAGQRNSGLTAEQSELVADLADAIHNIPEALTTESFDSEFHVQMMLGGFQKKYESNADAPKLLNYYTSELENYRKSS